MSTINYLISSGLLFLIFYVLYRIVLDREQNHQFKRIFLLVAAFASIFFPLINVTLPTILQADHGVQNLTQTIKTLPVLAIQSTNGSISSSTFDWQQMILISYWTGVLIMLVRFAWSLSAIIKLFSKNKSLGERESDYWVIPTNGIYPTCSFFNIIFWDDTKVLNPIEKQQVFCHENAHISQGHTFDVLFMEIIQIVWWFNPVIYLYKKQLCTLHEYLADQHVKQTMNDEGYISLLAKQWLSVSHLNIGNHFSKSQTIKRMNMMKMKPKKVSFLKVLLAAASIPIAFYLISCQSNDESVQATNVVEIEEIGGKVLSGNDLSENPLYSDYKNLVAENSESEYVVANFTTEEGKQDRVKSAMRDLNSWSLQLMKSEKKNSERSISAIFLKINPELSGIENKAKAEKKEIFENVENMPEPVGGFQAFFEELSSKLIYPEEARNNGIEGKVFVEFIVERDGSLTNANVKKGIGYGCDKAAIRAFEDLKKWKPGSRDGENVRVRMILPISFQSP